MPTDLAEHIQQTPLCNTHDHLSKEKAYVENGPDILQNLFGNYVPADLIVAGASQESVNRLLDGKDPDIEARFEGVRAAWEAVRHTGYGEAVRIIAREFYDLADITPEGLKLVQDRHAELRKPGQRLQILRERANLDHVQVDDFCWACERDDSGPDFFFYDISWAGFCSGTPDLKALALETGIEVTDLDTLQQAMEAIFDRYAKAAIAIKAQHAYNRTLRWRKRSPQETGQALNRYLRDDGNYSEEDRLCLGDWCWARGVELGIEHDLPFKLHTGYYAGHSRMPVDYIPAGHLCGLLTEYLNARFVLMHIAYPYSDELVGLAKHYPNVYPDLCWGWAIDPYSLSHFVRQCIHAVPANKLFLFGGDTSWPSGTFAYAQQTRRWLTRTLQAEVDEGLLSEREAMQLANRFMWQNQYDCFRVEQKKAAMRSPIVSS